MQWWPEDVDFEPAAGATREISWGDKASGEADVFPITVVDARPPRLFSFRWCYPAGEVAAPGNSLLVTFELVPSRGGTMLRLTETGFLEQGRDAAAVEEQYQSHVDGWDTHVPRLGAYVTRLVASR